MAFLNTKKALLLISEINGKYEESLYCSQTGITREI